MLDELKKIVCECNLELPRNGLVSWTSGNVSARDPETGYIVIKPSGISYNTMQPEDMVVVNLEGNLIEGTLKPSSDTLSHLVVYRQREDVNGIVHTHSNYATAFAVIGKSIPAFMTVIAEKFGGSVPVGAFAAVGGEAIGNEIVRSIGSSSAILMKNHGVFTIGDSPVSALASAIIIEDVAKTYWLALQVGTPTILSEKEVKEHINWHTSSYGQ